MIKEFDLIDYADDDYKTCREFEKKYVPKYLH